MVKSKPYVKSTLDIVLWLLNQAVQEDRQMSSEMLHGLLFIMQGSYAGANRGRKLMPAVFILDEDGLIEPNILRLFELEGANMTDVPELPKGMDKFLNLIWERYAFPEAATLIKKINGMKPYKQWADLADVGDEIPFEIITSTFLSKDEEKTSRKPKSNKQNSFKPQKDVTEKQKSTQELNRNHLKAGDSEGSMIRGADGKMYQKWMPPAAKPAANK